MKPNRRGAGQAPDPRLLAMAGALCAADAKTDAEIAAELGIARRTLARWKGRHAFKAAYDEVRQPFYDEWERLTGLPYRRRAVDS